MCIKRGHKTSEGAGASLQGPPRPPNRQKNTPRLTATSGSSPPEPRVQAHGNTFRAGVGLKTAAKITRHHDPQTLARVYMQPPDEDAARAVAHVASLGTNTESVPSYQQPGTNPLPNPPGLADSTTKAEGLSQWSRGESNPIAPLKNPTADALAALIALIDALRAVSESQRVRPPEARP